MQQFQVPQFIEVEDKIFGPLTIKQFVYILGGGGLIVILWLLRLPSFIFLTLAAIVSSFFGSLAFLKVNGQPFVVVLNNALSHVLSPRLYIWKKGQKETRISKETDAKVAPAHLPRLSESKLKDLSWSLDINEKFKR